MALGLGGFIRRGAQTSPSGDHVAGKTILFVGVPDPLTLTYMMMERLLDDGPQARMGTIFTVESGGTCTMTCIDADTVEIANPLGVLHSPFAALYSDRPCFSSGLRA